MSPIFGKGGADDAPEPQEAKAPPEREQASLGEVPGEAPTADLATPGAEQGSAAPAEPVPAAPAEAVPAAPAEPVASAAPADMPAAEPAPQAVPQVEPDASAVAGDGFGPPPEALPSDSYGQTSLWERPEVAIGAAFAGGLLLAILLRRRRS
jgi:hypothetical protein